MKKRFGKAALSLTIAATMLAGTAQTVMAEDAGDGKIVYWAQWSENETQAEVMKDAIARFEEANPEYTVEVNWAGREVRDILSTSIEAGMRIDVIESSIGYFEQDLCTDITEYMEGSEFAEKLIPSAVSIARQLQDDADRWYFIPTQPFVGTIFYNKAIFAEAGIEKLPETWDEFMDCCQKIVDAGYSPITSDDAYLPCLYAVYLGEKLGAEKISEMMSTPDASLWDTPEVLEMAQAYQEMVEKGYFTEGTGSFVFPTAQNTELALGTTAMYYNGSWLPNEVAEITGDDFQWGAMYFPSPDGAIDPFKTYSTGVQGYAVPSTSENVEGAVKLLEEFSSEQTQKALVEKCQCLPVIKGIEVPEALADCVSLMEEADAAVIWPYGVPNVDFSADVQGIVNGSFAKLLSGDINAEEFVQEVTEQLG